MTPSPGPIIGLPIPNWPKDTPTQRCPPPGPYTTHALVIGSSQPAAALHLRSVPNLVEWVLEANAGDAGKSLSIETLEMSGDG
jgi:hypothetical protein